MRFLHALCGLAGQYRTTERNIGVHAWKIPTELRMLRRADIAALQAADKHDIQPLLAFARN